MADYSHDTGGNFEENNATAESPPRKKQKIDDDTADFLHDFDDLLVRKLNKLFSACFDRASDGL
jgi:hypothetical protein